MLGGCSIFRGGAYSKRVLENLLLGQISPQNASKGKKAPEMVIIVLPDLRGGGDGCPPDIHILSISLSPLENCHPLLGQILDPPMYREIDTVSMTAVFTFLFFFQPNREAWKKYDALPPIRVTQQPSPREPADTTARSVSNAHVVLDILTVAILS